MLPVQARFALKELMYSLLVNEPSLNQTKTLATVAQVSVFLSWSSMAPRFEEHVSR